MTCLNSHCNGGINIQSLTFDSIAFVLFIIPGWNYEFGIQNIVLQYRKMLRVANKEDKYVEGS